MTETHEHRLKRLRIRAWRRGIKEMDLLIGGFVDARLSALDAEELDLLEAIMAEADQELLSWVTGQEEMPARYRPMMDEMLKTANQLSE